MNIKRIFEEELMKLKEDKNIVSIFLVGSADLNFHREINDIDLFVIIKKGERQIREIKYVKGIEFDINYFSIDLVKKLIQDKTQFFIEGMSKGKLVYDIEDIGQTYLKDSELAYEKGPKKIETEKLISLSFILLDNVRRIRNLEDKDWKEVEFLSSLYLRDIIRAYFMANQKWIPKDKKLFKVLRKENKELYELSQKLYVNYNTDVLEKMIHWIFKDIENGEENIKIIY